ncbi:hypothetical protein DFH28DRAFT_1077758 [Melampsora americana]|nr:hypothetical protein DFH28DRAFT_1077758 [Melampsora americana]
MGKPEPSKTLIHAYYRFVNPASPILPTPKLNGLVGLLCPVCSVPLVYKAEKPDAWLIACPTPDNNHNWRTWWCNQLNHEIALINLGQDRPIVSEPSAWGPRISPQGNVLEGLPPTSNAKHYHPFLHRAPASHPFDSTKTPNILKKKVGVECKRKYEGTLSQNHKTVANKDCPFQYCLGCCTVYGSVVCRKHPRAVPATQVIQQPTDHGQAPGNLIDFLPMQPTALGVSRRPAPASRAQPHKWAQASNTIGRLISSESVAMIHQNRYEREQAAARRVTSLIDETKVVTMTLWVKENGPQDISAYFAQWPLACLDESTLLLEAVLRAVGPQWNRALSVWDVQKESWRETLVNYPHHYPPNQRTLILRLPSVKVPTSAIPQSQTSNKGCISASVSNIPPPSSPTSPIRQSGSTSGTVVTPSKAPQILDVEAWAEAQRTPEEFLLGPLDPPPPDVDKSQAEEDIAQTGVALSRYVRLPWPSSSLLVSSLLDWYKDSVAGNPKQRWIEHFGDQYIYVRGTMYRYQAWIKLVDYEVMLKEFISKPKATVRDARKKYAKEYKEVYKKGVV